MAKQISGGGAGGAPKSVQKPVQKPQPAPPSNQWLTRDNLPVKPIQPKPRPADEWTTELDRLRAMGAQKQKPAPQQPPRVVKATSPRYSRSRDEEPDIDNERIQAGVGRYTYTKPQKPFAFSDYDADAWGRAETAGVARYSTSEVLREREIASRVGEREYVRGLMLPDVGKTKVDPWGVSAVITGVTPQGTYVYEMPDRDFKFTAEGRPVFDKPNPRDEKLGEPSFWASPGDRMKAFDEWYSYNPYSAVIDPNPVEKFILSFMPPAFANTAIATMYEFSKATVNANQTPVRTGVPIGMSLSLSALPIAATNWITYLTVNPEARNELSRVVAEQLSATETVANDLVNSYEKVIPQNVAEKNRLREEIIARILMEPVRVQQYESYLKMGWSPEQATRLMRQMAEVEADRYLMSTAIGTALADNGQNIVGTLFSAFGTGWNTYFGSFVGGEDFVNASVSFVRMLNVLGYAIDVETRKEYFDSGVTPIEFGAMVREGALAAVQPFFTETKHSGYAFTPPPDWAGYSALFATAPERFMSAYGATAAEIQKYSADNVHAQYQLAIDRYEEEVGKVETELERVNARLVEIGGVAVDKKTQEERNLLLIEKNKLELMAEIKRAQALALEDVKNSGVTRTIDDLELRWQNALDRIAAVEETEKAILEAIDKFIEAYKKPAFTAQQRYARDLELLDASKSYAEAAEVLEENPLRMADRAYTNSRFLYDMLAPSVLFDVVPGALRVFGIVKSAATARLNRAAKISGVIETLSDAKVVQEIAKLSDELHASYGNLQDAVHRHQVARSSYAAEVARATGVDPSKLTGKSVGEIDALIKESGYPVLSGEAVRLRKATEKLEKQVEAAAKKYAEPYAQYEHLLQRQADKMAEQLIERMKEAGDIAEDVETMRPGRRTPVSTAVRSSKSAAIAVTNETHRALIDVFLHVETKEDALQILNALRDPEKFLKEGVTGHWTSPVLFKATNNGVDALKFNLEPWKSKNARRGLNVLARRIDDFIEYLEADILKGTGQFNMNLLAREFDEFLQWSFAKDTWAEGARAKLPFGTSRADVATSKNGNPRIQYLDRNGNVIREVIAPDMTTARKLADEINRGAKSELFKTDPVQQIGQIKRKLLAVPFIGWNPANLIQQFMHPVVNSIFRVDGVNSTGIGRWGMRTLGQIERHVEKLFGTENPTYRHGSTDFAQNVGLGTGRDRTLVEKIMRPLGGLYVWVEEGSGKQFYYDAAMKFLQKYGRQVVDKVLMPNLIAEGVDPRVAKKAANAFYDVAYREGFEAGAKAALDVIDGNVTRYTMSDFDPNWASWMHPEVAREIEDILNSSTSIGDVDSRIAQVITKFDEAMQEFDVTTTPTGGGTRHAFTQADLLQDAAELKMEANNAKNNAPRGMKGKIDADFKTVMDALKRNQRMLEGLVAQIAKNENLPNVGNAFYHVWKAMRDGRTNISMRAGELAEAIHLAGGKQKWATDYWPQVVQMWTDYYKEMESVIAKTKEAIDNGQLDKLTRPEDMIVEHSRYTDEYLKNRLKIEPGSGAYDESLKLVMDAARAIERNQQSNFASVAQRSGAPWSRIFDEAVSAERDIAQRKIEIRGELNRLAEEVRKEFEATRNPQVWNEYYTQRNALWRNLYSEYVPSRWMEATRNILHGKPESLLNEIVTRFGNVTQEKAQQIINTIRTTLKPETLPQTRVISPSPLVNTNAFARVDAAELGREIFRALDNAFADINARAAGELTNAGEGAPPRYEFVARTHGGKVFSFNEENLNQAAKQIRVGNSVQDLRHLRLIEDAEGNVVWDANQSSVWKSAQYAFKAGDEVLWRSQDVETPVKITGIAGEVDGVRYYTIEGSNVGVPEDELISPKATKPSQGGTVTPVLAGVSNPAFSSQEAIGWFDNVILANQRMARNLWMQAIEEFVDANPGLDPDTVRTINQRVSEVIADKGREIKDTPYLEVGDAILAELSYPDWSFIPSEYVEQLDAFLSKAFREQYGETATDSLRNIHHRGFEVTKPQVNRANVAQKLAEAFRIPADAADSLMELMDAYARRMAEFWADMDGDVFDTPFDRKSFIDESVNAWYEETFADIVYSGGDSGLASAYPFTVAQVEDVFFGETEMRLIIRTLDSIDTIQDPNQRVRVALHELFHVFHEDMMKQAESGNKRATELLISLWEYVNDDVYRPGQRLNWTMDNMEQVAVLGETWLETGAAKVPFAQELFTRFQQWLENTVATYHEIREWIEKKLGAPGSGVTRAAANNIAFRIFDELFGGEKANVPSTVERVQSTIGDSSAPKAKASNLPKTTPDIVYLNMIRSVAKDLLPELAEALKGIKNLKDVPPHLLPIAQQMADIYAMRRKLGIAKKVGNAAEQTRLEKAIADAEKIHSTYSPEFRAGIKDGNLWANMNPNKKSPTPNTSALYSVEQLQAARTRIVDEMRQRSNAAQRAGMPQPSLNADAPGIPPDVRLKSGAYIYNAFRQEWDKVMHGANVAGDAMRSFTMTDFWNRTRADDFLQLISPFPFWATRDIKNGFERMFRSASFVWHMDRIDQALERQFNSYVQQERDKENRLVPARYRDKMGMFGGGWLPEWAQNFIPAGSGGEQVPIAVFWPFGLSRFFPTIPTRVRDFVRNNRKIDTGNAFLDMVNAGSMFGLSFDPWISDYLRMKGGRLYDWRMMDWTVQTRMLAWGALSATHPKDWNNIASAARPSWFEYSVAREVENMAQRGIIQDRMTLGLAMDYLYAMYNKDKKFDSPEWKNATPEQREAVWSVLIAARDAAAAKSQVQSGTGWATGFPIYLYDTAEGKTDWEQSVRRRLYYDPVANPLGTNEAANMYTSQNLSLQAADMRGKIIPKVETTSSWLTPIELESKTPRPVVLAATAQLKEEQLALDKAVMDATSKAVSDLLKKNPTATSSEMNAAKVEALLPLAREMLGDAAVDAWLAEQQKGLKKNQKVTYFGGLIELMRQEIGGKYPSAYTEKSNTNTPPPGSPRAIMQKTLAHGSPFSTIPEKAGVYNEALARLPSPENPAALRNEHVVAAVKLVVDLYKYPEFGSTKNHKEYAQKAQAADKKREEHLAKLLRISVEEARELLKQYKYRYMGEDEIKRREQIEAQGYAGDSEWSRMRRRRGYRGRRGRGGGYGGGRYGRGGGYGGGGEDSSSETDLLPSIKSYIQRRGLAGYLWNMPRSRYAVK